MEKIVKDKKSLESYLLTVGDVDTYFEIFLVTDGQIIMEIKNQYTVPLILIAAYTTQEVVKTFILFLKFYF